VEETSLTKSHLTIALAAVAALSLPLPATAQSVQDLLDDHKTPGDVVTLGMGYQQQRFSPLNQINAGNVQRLAPVWTFSTGNLLGEEGQVMVHDGVMYHSNVKSTFAIDALTGKLLWKHDIEYDIAVHRVVCCGIVNRGVAIQDGKVVRGTIDGHVLALDAKTGKEIWKTKSVEPSAGYSYTGAPLIAQGVVIVGVAGAEFGIRGLIEAFDLNTGARRWRFYVAPLPGEKGGDTWPANGYANHGGGSSWITGSYDPELDLVFWGTGNPAPWHSFDRPGDNLYTNCVLAFRPRTGELVWHYQFTPNDHYDYDGVNEMILADRNVNGQVRKVIMHADRNGFMYVLDRTNGKVIAANPFVKVNWAEKIDLDTGRPIETAMSKRARTQGDTGWRISPSQTGGKNYPPMAFSPLTGLVYANTNNTEFTYTPVKIDYKQGQFMVGVKATQFWPEKRGTFRAIDPMTGKAKWGVDTDIPFWAGIMVTGGNVVFNGSLTGEFTAYNATTGKKLWEYQTGSGVIGQPVTWTKDGRQYVTVASGISGVYALRAGDERLSKVTQGGSLWTFALPR
jgi:alcohol dehydrogenase (cytochrome c)